jgi:hypothetical protein
MKMGLLLSAVLFLHSLLYAQIYTEKDSEICASVFKYANSNNLKNKSTSDIIAYVGKSLLGTEYKAATLEREGEEALVINLKGLDCTTFLENAIVFARLIKRDSTTFNNYLRELAFIRYRGGELNGYPSRLHYFSDWIFDNIHKKVVYDVTKELGGIPIKFSVKFMSEHPVLYMHLKESPAFINVIKSQEDSISHRTYFYIPKDNVTLIEKDLHDGDIIAFTTSVKGLDIGHVGIAVRENDGRIHILHAPQPGTKVHITKEPLTEYIMNVKKHSGIIVLRAEEL